MPATPIVDPVSGESLVGTEPQLLQQVDPGWWRQRLNLYTGRALTVSALDSEQDYRGGLLATLGQSVTAGTVNGLSLTMDLSGADPLLVVTPGYGITASGQDVVLNSTLKAHLSTLTVIDAVTGNGLYSFHQSVGDPTNATHAGILLFTISRVVKAKTIHTPQGLFDLNYFFSASLGSNRGDEVSATVVKHRIKALVQAEDPAKPLSDETIARLLDRDGIQVARRTVNKYREELKIPPASRRRRR